MLTPLVIAAVVGYLLGSLPFGYLVARAKGVNIFEVGSKSPGATNVRRVLGAGPGNLVFFLDALKGVATAGWPLLAIRMSSATNIFADRDISLLAAVAGLIGALFGHSFSCFTKFRGGKGVATAAGGFLVLLPFETLIAGAVWILAFYASRYVSLASILAAVALPVATFFLNQSSLLLGLSALIAAFVIIRHRANIVRLLNGTENKFVRNAGSAS
ncbi:MAG TPA: glycerol-3-phosphate 1-O-acyltransferase PlsY [Opitutaceae bacterium]|nr:glycerol-3-phosphate 1-O-acyltransferase PlsY [Opitutaceae bacterium]